MSVVNRYNSLKILLTTLALLLSVIACQIPVPDNSRTTATPSDTPTPKPAPLATHTAEATKEVGHMTKEVGQTAIVRQATVNIRDAPDGAVIGQLNAGDEVVILSRDGDWVEIEKPHGWIFAGCLTLESGLGCEAK